MTSRIISCESWHKGCLGPQRWSFQKQWWKEKWTKPRQRPHWGTPKCKWCSTYEGTNSFPFTFFCPCSYVKRLCSTDTFQWSLTAGATTAHRLPRLNCSSLATQLTCARWFATSGTNSPRDDCTLWVRAPVRASFCLTWANAAPPATWRRQFASRPCSAARAGSTLGCFGLCSGPWCYTRSMDSAGMWKRPGIMRYKTVDTC